MEVDAFPNVCKRYFYALRLEKSIVSPVTLNDLEVEMRSFFFLHVPFFLLVKVVYRADLRRRFFECFFRVLRFLVGASCSG